MDVYDEILRLRRLGQKSAIATIVQVRGSIPSYESAKLLVREDGSMLGTIGGGCVEAEVWNAAREVIETEKPKHLTFNLGQDAAYDNGLICGGQLDIFIEPVIPPPRAFIFGAGHISKSLSKLASLAGFATNIIDNRDSFANRDLEQAESLVGLDELIDRANRRAVEDVLGLGDSSEEREYGLRMLVVSRCVERVGDHAVDIGEQTAYLVTGEFREFTDASHPVQSS